jgi:two-component system sensor histidine kinase KdpD
MSLAGVSRRSEPVFHISLHKILQFFFSFCIISAIIAVCYYLPHVNETTVALSMVLAILGIATKWGMAEAIVASITGSVEFDYFFLPPFGLGIHEPQHWLAQTAFLITAMIGGTLSAAARKKASEARARREEIEKLFSLQQVIHSETCLSANLRRIPEYIEQAFAFGGVACYFEGFEGVYRFGRHSALIPDDMIRNVASSREACLDKERSFTIVPVTLRGEPKGSLGVHGTVLNATILRAIVNLVELEVERGRSLEQAQRAETARKSEEFKSVILDALAHDLKTPLTTIKAAITCLLAQNSCPGEELLRAVNEETDRLNHLISDTISIAQAEASRIQLEKDQYDIKEMIETALQEMEPVLASRLVQVQTPVDSPQVEFDFNLVKQVLKQLLDNAVKYSPAGSPVTVCCMNLSNAVIIQVADAGAGIPAEEQEHVFERFYRCSPGSEVPGTGMGLAIAKRIIETHGGRIWVSSRLGIGSVFQFSLPLQKEIIRSAAKGF